MDFLALLLHKPIGITSFSAVKRVQNAVKNIIKSQRKSLTLKEENIKLKAGHTGTLDKHASGLLIVLLGSATRLSNFFLTCDKKYNTTFYLGKETDTLDSNGTCVAEVALPTRDKFEKAFINFRGSTKQYPPVYSAIHIDGKRSYKRARNNELVKMPLREITVYDSKIKRYEEPHVYCNFHVSSGTYIRSLVRDIAREAGSVAYMSALERTHIANISLDDALPLDVLESIHLTNDTSKTIQEICVAADKLLQKIIQIDVVHVKDLKVREGLCFGKMPDCVIHHKKCKNLFLYDPEGFLAFYIWHEESKKWKLIVHTA